MKRQYRREEVQFARGLVYSDKIRAGAFLSRSAISNGILYSNRFKVCSTEFWYANVIAVNK